MIARILGGFLGGLTGFCTVKERKILRLIFYLQRNSIWEYTTLCISHIITLSIMIQLINQVSRCERLRCSYNRQVPSVQYLYLSVCHEVSSTKKPYIGAAEFHIFHGSPQIS